MLTVVVVLAWVLLNAIPFFVLCYFGDMLIRKMGIEGGFFVSRGAKPESLGFGAVSEPVQTSAFINPANIQLNLDDIELQDQGESSIRPRKNQVKKKPEGADDEL